MRQGRLSKHEIKDMDEIDKLNKLKEEPHLSGAYIRSLVKQLTSSKSKDSMNPKDHLDSSTTTTSVDSDSIPAQNLTKFGKGLDETQHTQQTQQQPQQHKKQVRRRLHTTRPYQERLLNMAEARREIVTALKFHRAAMKQASEQQQQQQHQQQERSPTHEQPPPHPHHVEQHGRMKSRRNPRIYPSTTKTSNFSNYLDNLSYPQNFSHHHPPPKPYAWPASPITTLPFAENLNFSLPNQTLGLNLNFHDFNNIDTSLYHNGNNNPSFYSTSTASNSVSSPSSSSSPTLSTAVDQELVPVGPPAIEGDHHGFEPGATTSGGTGGGGSGGLHAAMDDEEMAEIRSIGEQHQMEWNDTMNLVTSAWWFKFLKTMELGGGPDDHTKGGDDDIDGYHPFDQVMEFPAWLSANDSDGCFQQHFDDYCPQDYFQNPALPCMDIGEFEGMDEEWLA